MISRLENELGRALDIALKHSVPTLNDIAPAMLAELKRLPGHLVNTYLKFHVREGHEAAFEGFTRDVIRGDKDPETWGYRDVLALVEEPRREVALTMSAEQLRARLGEIDGERWARYSVADAREVNRRASESSWGEPGVLVRHVPYWWTPPGKQIQAHGGSQTTELVSDADFAVAFRRWIAFRVAWWVRSAIADLAAASPRQVADAVGVSMDKVTGDGAIAMAALIREAQLPFDPDKHVRGYVGLDEWYAGNGDARAALPPAAPLTGQDAIALHDRLRADSERDRAEQLAAARADAAARGKEPFDLDTLERIVDTSSPDGNLAPVATRRARLEYQYYVDNPRISTLAEFALLLRDLRQW